MLKKILHNSFVIYYDTKYRIKYEDSTKYLETINSVMKEKYAKAIKALTVKRLSFRARLKNEALR